MYCLIGRKPTHGNKHLDSTGTPINMIFTPHPFIIAIFISKNHIL